MDTAFILRSKEFHLLEGVTGQMFVFEMSLCIWNLLFFLEWNSPTSWNNKHSVSGKMWKDGASLIIWMESFWWWMKSLMGGECMKACSINKGQWSHYLHKLPFLPCMWLVNDRILVGRVILESDPQQVVEKVNYKVRSQTQWGNHYSTKLLQVLCVCPW